MDILYSSRGRYVITASTSPVISFYDVDELRLRQVRISFLSNEL